MCVRVSIYEGAASPLQRYSIKSRPDFTSRCPIAHGLMKTKETYIDKCDIKFVIAKDEKLVEEKPALIIYETSKIRPPGKHLLSPELSSLVISSVSLQRTNLYLGTRTRSRNKKLQRLVWKTIRRKFEIAPKLCTKVVHPHGLLHVKVHVGTHELRRNSTLTNYEVATLKRIQN